MRYLIAIDDNGIYLRETLCVVHNEDTGEITYTAKHICQLSASPPQKELIERLVGKIVSVAQMEECLLYKQKVVSSKLTRDTN